MKCPLKKDTLIYPSLGLKWQSHLFPKAQDSVWELYACKASELSFLLQVGLVAVR